MLLRQIEYLQSVVENGNFYLAAEQCNVSQSAECYPDDEKIRG